jgi:glycosyltransferase involved in cell wall biosynthesis
MKLLRVIASLDPRHGGPSAGLRAITPVLEEMGHATEIVSFDDPARVASYGPPAIVHALGPVAGGYGYTPRLDAWLQQHVRRFDAVFVHGLWQYHGRAVRRHVAGRKPYFVFPHGMLDPWFRRAHPAKHLKKWVYWQSCERHVLRDAAAVLFTCEEERRLARQTFAPYQCTERVVAYGTRRPGGDIGRQHHAFHSLVPELGAQPYWLFLGRIDPKKGVDLLVDAYARLAAEHAANAEPLPALVLAGPVADSPWCARLRAAAAAVPAPGRVFWPGMLTGDAKTGALRDAEAFVLPSHQENFGIAVVESLAVGTPVLISHRINIAADIEAEGAGLVATDRTAGALQLLHRWQSLLPQQRERMRAAAAAAFERHYEIHGVARSLVETISPFLAPALPPDHALAVTPTLP